MMKSLISTAYQFELNYFKQSTININLQYIHKFSKAAAKVNLKNSQYTVIIHRILQFKLKDDDDTSRDFVAYWI